MNRHKLQAILFILLIALLPVTAASAQDGEGNLPFNQPVTITLNAGQAVLQSFTAEPGDSLEILLTPVTSFTYNALLLIPNQTPMPFVPGPDGSAALLVSADTGGIYTLLIQAISGSGDIVIQVNNFVTTAISLGQTTVDLIGAALQFSLQPPPEIGDTLLVVEIVPPTDIPPPHSLPATTLLQGEAREVMFSLGANWLSHFSATLPAQSSYLLAFEPGPQPLQILITWTEVEAPSSGDSSPPGDNTSGQPLDESNSSSPGTPTATYTPGGPTITPTYTPSATYTPGGPTVTPTDTATTDAGLVLPDTETPTSTPSLTYTPSQTYTPGGPTVTPTHTYTPTYTPTNTEEYTPTYTPSFTFTPTDTEENTATYTPTFTPSYTITPTYTPSYTPTTPPPPPVAPPDSNYALTIPLDSTASLTDFVSFPGGDTQDRVSWDISGMNPNTALSGGRARLIIAVSCFGTGTQNVTFFTGGQSFGCGQAIVDREVTNDSRTGSVQITAVAGENTYVQWVVTGTATRVN